MMSSKHNKIPTIAILAIRYFTIFTLSLIELGRPLGDFHVVKLRYSLAHIYYTPPFIKIANIYIYMYIITHCPKYCYSLSLKDSMQKRHGLCKNMRGNKKGQVPGTSKKKEKE